MKKVLLVSSLMVLIAQIQADGIPFTVAPEYMVRSLDELFTPHYMGQSRHKDYSLNNLMGMAKGNPVNYKDMYNVIYSTFGQANPSCMDDNDSTTSIQQAINLGNADYIEGLRRLIVEGRGNFLVALNLHSDGTYVYNNQNVNCGDFINNFLNEENFADAIKKAKGYMNPVSLMKRNK